ncbi:HalOD1 output domain-containing protein [Halobiforma nitratireducens]|uniref:Halobacterial output domain-containing protein n=1 Tax=Halobiforma nitratireducens JCM 10879 TaxID=1227454 RepID=M0M2N2_9EURY|nr:HalOD1 output domain-containing protein [Halobiforma nitratireducens]EMA40052.1 hypothetical protein C446_07774 [Halobiforma nitratireducens JCM 10879]
MTVEDAQIGGAELSSESRVGEQTVWGRQAADTPVYAIVSAVAEATGEDPCDLPPLARVIDPDSLNALLTAESATGDTSVRFQYVDRTVVVRGDGTVDVLEEDDLDV